MSGLYRGRVSDGVQLLSGRGVYVHSRVWLRGHVGWPVALFGSRNSSFFTSESDSACLKSLGVMLSILVGDI